MKGVTGLVIATTLAIAGGVCNWLYLARQADRYERVSFICVQADQIRAGEKFKEEHFTRVDIPKNNLGNLENVAVKWSAVTAVIGTTAIKDYVRDELLLDEDVMTPARENLNEKIGPNERVIWLPVDTRSFNPQHVNPGDSVSFRVPRLISGGPEPETGDGNTVPSTEEIIGPFRILALGNRKGQPELARAAGVRPGSENVVAISVEIRGNELEPKAQRILDILAMSNFKGVQVLLHPSTERK